MKVFSKILNIHLYIKQNETKKKKLNYTSHGSPWDSTCILIYNMIFLMSHYFLTMHIN
jgi:amino acid permease